MVKKGQIATAAHHFEVLEGNRGRQWQFLHNFTNALLRIEVGRTGPFENFDHGLPPYNDANVWTIIGDRLRDDFNARNVVWNWEHFSFFPSWWLIFVEARWRKKIFIFSFLLKWTIYILDTVFQVQDDEIFFWKFETLHELAFFS